uniref:Uncharacterized protein n=1 Tax=Parascaris equorum TaxID=6256 RepID=A0A914SFU6_PAREQ
MRKMWPWLETNEFRELPMDSTMNLGLDTSRS